MDSDKDMKAIGLAPGVKVINHFQNYNDFTQGLLPY